MAPNDGPDAYETFVGALTLSALKRSAITSNRRLPFKLKRFEPRRFRTF